jgi:uncharacterized membrane protein YsdA (DUF1294 family)
MAAGWLAATNALSFALFAYDKWQAGRRGPRVAESSLWLISAFGGWPGGLLGILVLRHKSAKTQFQIKFTLALVVWMGLLWAIWRLGEGPIVGRISLAGRCECSRGAVILKTNHPSVAASSGLRSNHASMDHKNLCG